MFDDKIECLDAVAHQGLRQFGMTEAFPGLEQILEHGFGRVFNALCLLERAAGHGDGPVADSRGAADHAHFFEQGHALGSALKSRQARHERGEAAADDDDVEGLGPVGVLGFPGLGEGRSRRETAQGHCARLDKSSACFHKDLRTAFPKALERIIAGVNRKRASESGLAGRAGAHSRKIPQRQRHDPSIKRFFRSPALLNNPPHRFEYAGKPMCLAKRYTGFDISGIPQ